MRKFRSIHVLTWCVLAAGVAAACAPNGSDAAGDGEASAKSAGLRELPQKVPQSPNAYTLFESLQVRPVALSPNGRLLFVTNTPDNRLEIFRVHGCGLEPLGSVQVGLEPVAVAARTDDEVWVVNHLSDSVSIVRLDESGKRARVVRTLNVGDEPRDIVFAGRNHDRAFVTTAHRGQNSPDDPDLFAPGVGRADVWVFDANELGDAPGGQRLTKLTLFADTPRALAVTPDGSTVYAAAFFSGNQTTSVSEDAVQKVYGGNVPGLPSITLPTPAGPLTIPQPPTGLIVKWKAGPDGAHHWFDPYGTSFDDYVRVRLPDKDVFAIDATANPPKAVKTGEFSHVGTTLFNMAVNPKSGKVYVSNTEAHNDVRFEGHAPGFTTVRGNAVESRISVIDPATSGVVAANLNPHIDHENDVGDPSLSVAFPQDLAVTGDGTKLVVVAQGSGKLAIYDTAALESGTATPSADSQVMLSGGGPTGVALGSRGEGSCDDDRDDGHDRHDGEDDHGERGERGERHGHRGRPGLAFVHTRFDNGISVVDLATNRELSHVTMYNPEPPNVTAGRQYLYDATRTSAHGDQACASCHIGGDLDGLAWDLGNPGGIPLAITQAIAKEPDLFTIPEAAIEGLIGPTAKGIFAAFQPSKGPMTTQSLRGLDNHGAMHWRGDRNGAVQQSGVPFLNGGTPVVSAQPNAGMFDEFNAFKSFNVAFPGLVGNAAQLSDGDMTDFTNFALEITYPPNPIRNLDDSLTPEQQAGRDFYFNHAPNGAELPSDRFHACNGCHVLDAHGNEGATKHPGFFGTDGRLSFENESQIFKVPHLRNAYQKIGMYASSPDGTHAIASLIPQLNPSVDAVRGFGFQHDGATATLEHFLSAFVFIKATKPVVFAGLNVPPNPFGIPLFADSDDPLNPAKGISLEGVQLRRSLASFTFAFDANMKPVVGQQVTLTTANGPEAAARIALLETQAAAGACDLVVRGRVRNREVGFVLVGGAFKPDTTGKSLSDGELRGLVGVATEALTFTAVPPGSGVRIGIDRDGDGYADGDELALGTNPSDPTSHP